MLVSMRRTSCFVIAAICLGAFIAPAQSVDGVLTGIVTDPSGAAVPEADVTATNQTTGVQYSVATTGQGEYRLEHMPVGLYDVKAAKQGFASQPVTSVQVELNRITTMNLGLALASSAAVVIVEASTPIDSAASQLQTNYETRSLIDTPIATTGSGFINLSLLSAGVGSSGGYGYGEGPVVGGQRPTGNRFFIEGADNNSYFATGALGPISNEAIAEFTLLQNNFGPEFGGGVGGIFNAVLKTGGNDLHGSLYEYNQNRDLDALDAIYARQKLTSPPRYDNNRLGMTIGGPILKDKLFYFGNFEYNPVGYAYAAGQPVYSPTAAGYQTLNSMGGLSKTNLGVLEQYLPAAPQQTAFPGSSVPATVTVAGTSIPVGLLAITSPVYANTYRGAGSIDWDINDKDRVRGRYVYNGFSGIDTSSATLPTFFVTRPSDTHLVSLSEYHSFSPATQNELRVSYSRNNSQETASNVKLPGLQAFPEFYFEDLGLTFGPSATVPNGTIQGELQASDMITRLVGKHALQAGYNFGDIIQTTSFVSYAQGLYEYSSVGLFLQDVSPNLLAERFLSASGSVLAGMPAGFLRNAAYFNDDYRVLPNLTLNLGVRYEYVTVPILSRAQQLSALASVPGVITFNEPQPTKNNWSPRLGFAYSPGSSGLWSIRGGFSRAFDMPYTNIAANTAPEFYGSEVQINPNVSIPSFLANGGITGTNNSLASVSSARAYISSFVQQQQLPYAVNATLSVQRRIGQDYLVEARYLSSRGDHLLVQTQLNRNSIVTPTQYIPTFLTTPSAAQLSALTLTTGALTAISNNPWAGYGLTGTITDDAPRGNSDYNGLALQVTRRYSRNLSMIAAYTWSHTMDDSTAVTSSTLLTPRRPQDFNDIAADWSTSMLSRAQRLTISPVYDIAPFKSGSWALRNLLGNWTASFTYIYESPEYATVQSGINSNLNGDSFSGRAIVNPAGSADVGSGVTGINASGQAVASNSPSIVAYVANNPNARYIVAGVGALANGGRNTFPLAPIDNIDASIRKRLAITERVKLEVGIEFFNLLNHPQFTGGYPNDVQLEQNSNRNFLIPSNSAFGQYQQFFPSNSRYGQVLARITF